MHKKPVEFLLKEKKIYQVINQRLVQAPPETSITDAVALMQERRSGYIVVAKKKKVVGMFTEVDLIRKILGKSVDWKSAIQDYMTKDPFVLSPKDTVGSAIKLMGTHKFYHIPLVDENKELTGVLSVRTLIRFLAEFYPTEIYNLPPHPNQVMQSREGG